MKYAVIWLIAVLATPGWAGFLMKTHEIFKEYSVACAKENDVDLAVFDKMKTEKKPDFAILSQHNMKCFFACIAAKGGLIDDEDKPNVEMIVEKFNIDDKEAFVKAGKACMENAKETEKCDKVFEMVRCMMAEFKH